MQLIITDPEKYFRTIAEDDDEPPALRIIPEFEIIDLSEKSKSQPVVDRRRTAEDPISTKSTKSSIPGSSSDEELQNRARLPYKMIP
jgi:hypothetical protein